MGFDWISPKNYKRHYICLKCQKGFKRPSEKDMKQSKSTDFPNLMSNYYAAATQQDIVKYIEAAHQKMNVICPNCQHQMVQVHYNFEVPALRDNKSWKMLQKNKASEIAINYERYIHWHRLELQKAVASSVQLKLLKQNITKLERMLTD